MKRSSSRGRGGQSTDGEGGDGPARPDFFAQEISPSKKGNSNYQKIKNFDDSVKKIDDDGVEVYDKVGNDTEGNQVERLDTQSKGFETLMNEELEKQKSEMGKKKRRAAVVKKKSEEKKKKRDYFEKEAANCVQFCIWNCKENHRCVSLFRKYNPYISRSSRWILLTVSWLMFIMIAGYLVVGGNVSNKTYPTLIV